MRDETGGRLRQRFLAAMGIPLTLAACSKPSGGTSATPEPTIPARAADTPSALPSATASALPSATASALPSATASSTPIASTTKTAIARSAGPATWPASTREICMGAHDTVGPRDPATSCGLGPGEVVWGGGVSRPCGPCSFAFSPTVTHAQRAKRPDACCFTGSSPSGPGRLLRVEGNVTRAPFTARADWLDDAATPDVSGLDAKARAALAQKWRNDAALEHASVGAFALVALRLLAYGAPADLVAGCHHAALDEVKHAAACYALATAYAGEPVGPGALVAARGMEIAMPLDAFAVETLVDGCVGELVASLEARDAAARATDPVVAAILERIADDEERHAELAWKMLAWACSAGGERVLDALRTAGRSLDCAQGTALRRDAVRTIGLPCLAALARAQ